MPERDRTHRRSAVETELASAEAKISQLQRELFDIRQRLNDTTPILDILPADIMVEIFQRLLPWPQDPELVGYGCQAKPVQLTLGAVCRTWRNIAWGFPGLWKEIYFTASAQPDRAELQVGLVQEWIHRTGGLPLHISLLVQTTNDDAVLDRILRILLQECQRWKTFKIAGNASHQLRTEMSDGDYSFPMLTTLSLGHDSHTISPTLMSDLPWTFNTGSTLQYLTLGKDTDWSKEDISVNWTTIRHLRFVGDEVVGLSIISEMAESLVSVKLLLLASSNNGQLQSVVLPALQEVVIGDDEYPEPIADHTPVMQLETPALQRLHIYLDDVADIPLLSEGLLRSQCSLVDLSLENLDAAMDTLIEFLRTIPSLRIFFFTLVGECSLTDDFIDAMNTRNGQASTYQPCLPTVAEIAYEGRISFKPQKIIGMLRSRVGISQEDELSINKQIKSFTILCKNPDWATKTDPNVLQDFYNEIWSLKSVGTNLGLIYEIVGSSVPEP